MRGFLRTGGCWWFPIPKVVAVAKSSLPDTVFGGLGAFCCFAVHEFCSKARMRGLFF